MNIGLVGSGGREHALAVQLAKNRPQDTLAIFGSHANPAMQPLADHFLIGDLKDVPRVLDFFILNKVDLAVIGPETPLMEGIVDSLREKGIPTVGPTRSQARIEGDKSFMRDLVDKRIGWGSPRWLLVSSSNLGEARSFIEEMGQVAVKPLGLTSGKGVRVMGVHLATIDETLGYAGTWVRSTGSVLLEERLVGEEFSRIVLVSGKQIASLPVAQDYKYAFDNDTGPMTGGMGAYTMPNGSMPFLRRSDLVEADRFIGEVVNALEVETGQDYHGFLYGQFMATARGVQLIEFNARLGDPEGINIMFLLDGNVPGMLLKAATNTLVPGDVRLIPLASVVKYLVPQSYPEASPELSFTFNEEKIARSGLSLICSSVIKPGREWITQGSRTMALLGLGLSTGEISARIESLLDELEPPGLRHRRDIGSEEIIQQKVTRMEKIRKG